MTNYEKIKSMSLEEMAEWLDETLLDHDCCVGIDVNCEECDCISGRKKWLESEAKDDKN